MKPGLPWLAGILEGEGSFMMTRNNKIYFYPKIVVNMTDKDVIDAVATMFGTKTYVIPKDKRGDWKQMYRATLTGGKAAAMMTELLPYMGERRSAKILDILEQYGKIESTEERRRKSCQEAYKNRKIDESGRFVR